LLLDGNRLSRTDIPRVPLDYFHGVCGKMRVFQIPTARAGL
jgi:hypothetical protein